MNFIRSYSIGTLGQWRSQAGQTSVRRRMCSKPAETETPKLPQEITKIPPAAPAPVHHGPINHLGFQVPGLRPGNWDRRFLIWTGRFKTVDQIPETVSIEMIHVARNKMRVKVCYGMMVATILGCFAMVYLGKQDVKNHKTLTMYNMEKHAMWREEGRREREAAAVAAAEAAASLAEKAQ